MATALGINNPNSRYNRFIRATDLPDLPLTRQAEIRVTLDAICAVKGLWKFHYQMGNRQGARLQAIRLVSLRAELRQLQRGV